MFVMMTGTVMDSITRLVIVSIGNLQLAYKVLVKGMMVLIVTSNIVTRQ
jgi:hypothetical protein